MAKETHPVDDFFRRSLQDHKIVPSETARGRFLEEAGIAAGKGRPALLRWYSLLPAAALIAVAVFLYSRHSAEIPSAPEAISSLPLTQPAKAPAAATSQIVKIPSSMPLQKNQKNPPASLKEQKRNAAAEKAVETAPQPNQKAVLNASAATGTPVPDAAQSTLMNPVTGAEVKSEISGSVAPLSPPAKLPSTTAAEAAAITTASVNPETSGNQPESAPKNTFSPRESSETNPTALSRSAWQIVPCLRYSLDWSFSGSGNKLSHSLALEAKIQRGRFSLTSGAAISVMNGYHRYQVAYNDYLGEYKKLDSITFTLSKDHFHLVPSYYSTAIRVWDSTVKLDSYQVEQRYSLVRIPVMLGYRMLNRGRFSLGLNAGLEMTFYLNSHTLSGEYSAGMNKIVNVNSLADELSRTNIYGRANLSAACELTRSLTFELEPGLQYLLNASNSSATGIKQSLLPGLRSSLKLKF